MNQTKKRLSIINLAISMTDIETIQLQIAKLIPLKTDVNIQEIIRQLQKGHYGKSQELIDTYIETPIEIILENNSKEARRIKNAQESAIIDKFDLFVTGDKKEESSGAYDNYQLKEEHKLKKEPANFDALLNIQPDDILTNSVKIDISQKKPSALDEEIDESQSTIDKKETPEVKEVTPTIEIKPKEIENQKPEKVEKIEAHSTIENSPSQTQKTLTAEESTPLESQTKVQKEEEKQKEESDKPLQYSTIPHIEQKFKAMQAQYPPVHQSDEEFTTVKRWLHQIMHGGYNSNKIEEIVAYIHKLVEAKKYEEAAQLMLVTGATESKFAQFILARELYKGGLLQRNLPESFALIYSLAMNDDYPEAICDLAQFYEYGIGIDKDKEEAEALYKSAMEQGISRAKEKYEKLQKKNRSFFSAFKK